MNFVSDRYLFFRFLKSFVCSYLVMKNEYEEPNYDKSLPEKCGENYLHNITINNNRSSLAPYEIS